MQKKTKATRARGPRSSSGRSTRERILDAAERLFAAQGFHAVSVRDITAAAGVDVALVNYHFGGKHALFEDVFMRRAEVLNAERLRRLELLVAKAAPIAQVNNSTEFGGLMMTRYFDPVVHAFIAALRSTMPDCDERDIYWSYHFLSGALTLTFAETGRIDNLSQGLCRSSDLDSVHERLVPYVAAGFRALCVRSAAAKRRSRASGNAVRSPARRKQARAP